MSPPKKVFRVGFGDHPAALRPWETIDRQHRPAGRFDDPEMQYRVLYASSTPEGAYRESLQKFRPSKELLAALKEIQQNDPQYTKEDFRDFGVLPLSWLTDHRFVEITLNDRCDMVKVTDGAALDLIQIKLGHQLDASTLLSADRDVTQRISRLVYLADEHFVGIVAESKLGTDFVNFAFFEDIERPGELRVDVVQTDAQEINARDPALVDVANAYSLKIPGYEEHADGIKRLQDGDCSFDEFVDHIDALLSRRYATQKPGLRRKEKAAVWFSDENSYVTLELREDGSYADLTGERLAPERASMSEEGREAWQSEFAFAPQKSRVNTREVGWIANDIGYYLVGIAGRLPANEADGESNKP